MKLSKEQLLKLVRAEIDPVDIERSCIYWDQSILRQGQPVRMGPQKVPMPFDGTVVFIDLAPQANWAHPCCYLLVAEDGTRTELVEASFPPYSGAFPASYTIILRYGKQPPHERYFQVFD